MGISRYRYPGVNFFTEEDEDIYHGRDKDTERLFTLIMTRNTMVLHGDSGNGKSSLIRAGLIPELKRKKPDIIPIVLITKLLDDKQVSKTDNDLVDYVIQNIRAKIKPETNKLPYIEEKQNDLWYLIKSIENSGKSILLILDQFENLNSYSDTQILNFKKQLFNLFNFGLPEDIYKEVTKNTEYILKKKEVSEAERKEYNDNMEILNRQIESKILFAVREDKLGTMSLLKDYLPDILKNEYLLLPLDKHGAEEAIKIPAGLTGEFDSKKFSYNEYAVKHLIDNLNNKKKTEIEIDPFLLQIICRSLEKRIIKNANIENFEITEEYIGPIGDIISVFYDETWEHIQNEIGIDKDEFSLKKKQFIQKLISGDKRPVIFRVEFPKGPKDDSVLENLKSSGIIREIITDNGIAFQLNHDRLIDPLKYDLDLLQRKENYKIAAKLLEEGNRRKDQLLKDEQERAKEQRERAEKETKLREEAENAKKNIKLLIVLLIIILVTIWSNLNTRNLNKSSLNSLINSLFMNLRDSPTLDLSNSNLTKYPTQIDTLNYIQTLNLSNNHFATLPPNIGKLKSLQFLDLSYNQFTSLPDEFANLTSLQSLSLSSNQLTSFPDEIANLTSLQSLDLNDNKLISLPDEIARLTSLQSLYLSDNQLTLLPDEIAKLTSLQFLQLGRNQLTSFPHEIAKLTSLQSLVLDSNQLTSLPDEIAKLTSLQYLFLSSNQLTSLPDEIGKLTSLQSLYLSHNQLTSLPDEIGKLTSLQYLDLSYNKFSKGEIERLEKLLPNCKILYL